MVVFLWCQPRLSPCHNIMGDSVSTLAWPVTSSPFYLIAGVLPLAARSGISMGFPLVSGAVASLMVGCFRVLGLFSCWCWRAGVLRVGWLAVVLSVFSGCVLLGLLAGMSYVVSRRCAGWKTCCWVEVDWE